MNTNQPKVTVFGTLTCPWCVKVKNYLKEKNVEFENKDVTFDQNAADEMIKKSGTMGVPQLWIDEKVVVGFDKETIDQLLNIK